MARIAPANLNRVATGGRQGREIETLLAVQSSLPDDYIIFHSVHWTREYQGDTVYGEIDFAVVNRAGEVLIIEQKNGSLKEQDGGLFARYPDGDKNVVRQVHRSLDNLRDKFRRQHVGQRPLDLEYLIYCPAHHLVEVNAAGLDASHVVDASNRRALGEHVQTLLGPGDPADTQWAEIVRGFFYQTFDLVPDIHAFVVGQERSFTRLSGGLVAFLDRLEMKPRRLRVRGTAGCGKTMIARHFFDRAVAAGHRPLLICFNRSLAERLKIVVQPGGVVSTWYGFCAKFLEERGHRLDFEEMRVDPTFWDRVCETVIEEMVPEAWRFDAVIVDEGQDFEPVWVDLLWLFARPGADVLWLEDPDQNLRRQPPVSLDAFVGYQARVNYRSPRTIATFIRRALPRFDFECGSDLPGLGVGVRAYDEPAEQSPLVARIVADLLRQGFRQQDIVLLTSRHVTTPGAPRSVFSTLERVGNYKLRRFTGEYDLLGNQVFTDGQIIFDSITRFKGQEAPAVILADVDSSTDDELHDARLLFSGMTRATVRLELLVRRDNPLNAPFLERLSCGSA